MARAIRSAKLETRTARLRLPIAKKPVFVPAAKGIRLGYRRNKSAGPWIVKAADGKGGNWTKAFAIADDFETADGEKILTYWQALDKARKLARGQDVDAGRPVTVSEALDDYAADLTVRVAGANNAKRVRLHLPPSLLAKPVSLLVMRELRYWRNEYAKRAPASTVNRTAKGFKAALNFAAAQDDRITNAKAWTVGLAALGEDDDTESNIILTDQQRRAVVAAAYAISPEFGLFVEVHAVIGARSSQIALLDCADLQMNGSAPRLMVPSSLKGKNRKTRSRKPMPIPVSLAKKLQAAVAGRAASEPLLVNPKGGRWFIAQHFRPFRRAAAAAGLPDASIYCLRHTAVTRALLAGVAVRLVASSFDTSVAMIEKTYSKFITDHGDAQMRRGLFDADAPEADKVVPLRGR